MFIIGNTRRRVHSFNEVCHQFGTWGSTWLKVEEWLQVCSRCCVVITIKWCISKRNIGENEATRRRSLSLSLSLLLSVLGGYRSPSPLHFHTRPKSLLAIVVVAVFCLFLKYKNLIFFLGFGGLFREMFFPSSKTHRCCCYRKQLGARISNIPRHQISFLFHIEQPTSTFYAATFLSPLPFVSKFGIGNCFDLRPPTTAPLSLSLWITN